MENQLGLQFLPPEVIGEIAIYLSTQDISACSATCFLLRQALNDDLVWKKRCSFKELDYFKWGECEVEPNFEWEKNEPSSLPLPKVCTWRKYIMMQAHLWRNWKFGDFKTVEFEFGSKSQVFAGTQVVFYENDFLFLHSYDVTQPNTLDEIWSVQRNPFLHSTLSLNVNQYVGEDVGNYCSSPFKINIVDTKLVISLKSLVLIYDITLSSFSKIPLDHAFFFDGSNGESYDTNNETSIVSGDCYIGVKSRTSAQDPANVKLTLYLWNIKTGEKMKEEDLILKSTAIENYSLLMSEDKKHLILKLRVKKNRYMYHYYGYNISKLEFSKFVVKVNYCDFEVFFNDNVIGAGLQQLFVYSYATSEKIAIKKCNHEILKKTIKIVGGYLLFGTFDNVVYVLNPSNLALINEVKLGFTIYSLRPICDKFVLINSTNCEVWKIGKTAKKLFKLPVDVSFAAVNQYGTKLAVIKRNMIKILNFW